MSTETKAYNVELNKNNTGKAGTHNAKEFASLLNALAAEWSRHIYWAETATHEEGLEVQSAIFEAAGLASAFARSGEKKHSETPAQAKARELREKADELLTQAKDLETALD